MAAKNPSKDYDFRNLLLVSEAFDIVHKGPPQEIMVSCIMDKQDLDLISVLKILGNLLPRSSWQLPVGHVLLNLLELERKTLDQDQ